MNKEPICSIYIPVISHLSNNLLLILLSINILINTIIKYLQTIQDGILGLLDPVPPAPTSGPAYTGVSGNDRRDQTDRRNGNQEYSGQGHLSSGISGPVYNGPSYSGSENYRDNNNQIYPVPPAPTSGPAYTGGSASGDRHDSKGYSGSGYSDVSKSGDYKSGGQYLAQDDKQRHNLR